MVSSVEIALVGFGTIGQAVYKLLERNQEVIARAAGADIQVKRVLDLDASKKQAVPGVERVFTTSRQDILDDDEIRIVVEVAGGVREIGALVLDAIARGKHIVTANKALLAEQGDPIFRAAAEQGVAFEFEASVAGAIPIVRALRDGFPADRIGSVYGIINGTANYVLSRMTDEGAPFDEVLREAQRIGYAEADPSLDIDGLDVAHKLAILLRLAFGVSALPKEIYTEGIRDVSALDVAFAKEFGLVIKLLAIAKEDGQEGVEARVHPTMIPHDHLLADVRGVMNAVYLHGEALGPMVFTGAGAGGDPTSTAVCADIISIVRRIAGRKAGAARIRIPALWSGGAQGIKPMDRVRSHYYLRFTALDRPGVLSLIAGCLGRHDISISSMIQKGREEMRAVPIVIMTHEAEEANLSKALREIDRLDVVTEPSRLIRIEDRLP